MAEVVFDSILVWVHAGGMSNRSPVFAQIMCALDPTEFARCVARFPSPRVPRGLSAYDHFLALCFAQLTYRESLRDIVACLNARTSRAYHMGLRSRVTRTNLAYANQHRDWRVFAAVAQRLMQRAQKLYREEPLTDDQWPAVVYALDASLIELSCALFPWAWWQGQFAAVKLHTLLNLRGHLPAWCLVTEVTFADQKTLAYLPAMPGALIIMDRGYLDFPRLAKLVSGGARFVVRAKTRLLFRVLASRPVNKTTGLRCDQSIALSGRYSRHAFVGPLRRVCVRDEATKRSLVLLTNDFALPAQTIGELYRRRWQVELFFKWIKQHLRVRAFFGRTPNAVQVQIWTAICAYLLTAIARKQLKLPQSLHQILQIVSVSAFEQTPLPELVMENAQPSFTPESPNQLLLKEI
jgi:DDE family transposase/uncharacterized protein DUF4372